MINLLPVPHEEFWRKSNEAGNLAKVPEPRLQDIAEGQLHQLGWGRRGKMPRRFRREARVKKGIV